MGNCIELDQTRLPFYAHAAVSPHLPATKNAIYARARVYRQDYLQAATNLI